jgi:hypothetical protein
VALLAVGCSGKAAEVTTPPDHPAHPDATEAVFKMPLDVLPQDTMSTEEGASEHHEGALLSTEGEEALTTMLDAYFAIGDQLASDTMDAVNEEAHAMLEAFHTLEHQIPSEIWHFHDGNTEAIHDYGHELGDLSDIHAARIAYGSLSDSFKHLVRTVGVPANYGKAVYSYVCGMASDVPEEGIWLQIGEKVRNQYFGSAMLKCHSEKMQMPVSSADMSGREDMNAHEHKQEKDGHESRDHDMHNTQAHEEIEPRGAELADDHEHDVHQHNH